MLPLKLFLVSFMGTVVNLVLNYVYFLEMFKPRSLLFVVAGKNEFTNNRVLNLVVVVTK